MKNFFTLCLALLSICIFQVSAQAQITGKVTDSQDGSGLPGVNILVKGTSNGTTTNVNGEYSINASAGQVLIFTYVGYLNQEITVGSSNVIDVSLVSDNKILEDVVVVGYGEQEAKDVTGAINSIKAEDFNQGVISSPEQLIQGRTAGVQITAASGEPGAGVNIRIRGTSSITNTNNPLFVVDGVPLASGDLSGGGQDGGLGTSAARNPLNFLNPNDIASIDILKDASATAIYGSRGANGVVIITTKSGNGAGGGLNYSSSISFSTITKKYDLLDRDAFLAGNAALGGSATDGGASTDWQDEILRTAISNSHNISYGDGNASGNYLLSVSYLDQQGIIQESGLRRITARFNATKKFLNDKLTVGTQITVSDTRDKNVPITDNAGFEGDLLGNALKFNPTQPVRNPDGTFFQPGVTEINPVAMLAYNEDFTNNLRTLANISAAYEILEGFSFKTVIGIDRGFSSRKSAWSRDLVSPQVDGVGRLFLGDVENNTQLWENYFTLDREFGSVGVSAVLGYSYQRFLRTDQFFEFSDFRTSDLNLMINNFASANQANGEQSVVGRNSSRVEDELQSFYGRVALNFSDKYLFTATLRADGSTRFGSGNQYGYFPSFAFKWRLGDENFAPDFFSNFDLRLGFGITGNQEIPHNLFEQRQRYNDWDIDAGGNVTGGGLGTIAFPNPDLKWESTTQYSVGIDYGFFDGRLTGSIDYYYKTTNDLLIQVQSAQPAAQPFVWTNLDADIVNTGVEFSLNAIAVDNGDFSWEINGNVAYNDNEVRNFDGQLNTGDIDGQGLTGAFAQRIAAGQPLFAFFLREFGGFDSEGIATYVGGDVQRFTGQSPLPTVTAGLTNTIKYKDLSLSFFFTGQFGQSVYSNTANAFFTAGSLANGRNVTTDVPGNGESNLNAPDVSTLFLENADFVRLQNVTLAYNFTFDNAFISSLRLFVTGQDLFVITGYSGQDPEVNVNKPIIEGANIPSFGIDYTPYPRARTFTLGFNAKF